MSIESLLFTQPGLMLVIFMFVKFQDWSSVSQPSATDNLTAAIKSNILPNQEYLLQGSVLDSSVEVLLQRLRGLCDNVDTGPEPFHDHEMCFSISNFFLVTKFFYFSCLYKCLFFSEKLLLVYEDNMVLLIIY